MKILDVPQSGSVAGDTSSRNRFGQYRRTRAVPVNPNTARQVLARGRLATASAAWRSLSNAQRTAWNEYAATQPQTDSLGQTVYLTGAQQYVRHFTAWTNAGLTPAAVPPSGATPAVPVISSVVAVVADNLTVTVAAAATALVPIVLELSPQVSPGVSYQGDFRWVANFATGTALSAMTAYEAKFGPMVEGQKIFVRARAVSLAGGISAGAESSVIVDA